MSAALHTQMRRNRRCGQAALEYIIVFAVLIAASGAAFYFLRSPADIAVHTTDVLCSDRL